MHVCLCLRNNLQGELKEEPPKSRKRGDVKGHAILDLTSDPWAVNDRSVNCSRYHKKIQQSEWDLHDHSMVCLNIRPLCCYP